jgi:tRNA nucleotidyltransferase (CCA-adding enzyme)
MFRLAPLMDNLARERVFEELCKILLLVNADDLLRFQPVLTQVTPELAPTVGFDQHSRHHIYDIYEHTAQVVAAVPPILSLRWAALLHDVGKPATFSIDEAGEGHFYGHAEESAAIADAVLRRLKAPTQLREDVVLLIRQHMAIMEPDKRILRRRLSRLGSEKLELLLALQEADTIGTGTRKPCEIEIFSKIRAVLEEIEAENACLSLKDLTVKGNDLMALGITGPAIGKALNALLELVIDEQLPNEKPALMAWLANHP